MTQFLVTGRQEGKTSAAVRWVRGGVRRQLVVPDERQVAWVEQHHFPGASDLHPEKVITYSALMSGRWRGTKFNELAVDNLDLLLDRLFPCHVGFVTATGEDARLPPNTIQLGGSS